MRRKRLAWRLFPSYLLVFVLPLIAVSWFASDSFRRFSLNQTASDLEIRAHLVADRFTAALADSDPARIQQLCHEAARSSSARVTVVLPTGEVAGDSQEEPGVMDNHADRPEVIDALRGDRAESIRYSFTLNQNMMYVAIPIVESGEVLGVLRLSRPLTAIEEELKGIYIRIVVGGIIVVLLAAGVSWLFSRGISRLLEKMRRGAARFADGDLSHKLEVSGIREVGDLAESMNQMAAQLHDRMQTITRQRNEQEAVLASMVEGVLAVDDEERVLGLNRAAADLLHISRTDAPGRMLQEVVRNPALLDFVTKVLASHEAAETEIILYDRGDRYLQAHGTILRDARGVGIGAVVVLNDVTRIRRLENVRRDFVANVSHELKTPVTSVKGFVETLLEGALENPDEARRFLKIVLQHANRLQAIIEDLLMLSRLEQDTEKGGVVLEKGAVKPILEAAVQACGLKASEKNITVTLECPDLLETRINAPLLEQAVINLIDNAIKFSEPGDKVDVIALAEPGRTIIKVIDFGSGIPEEHLSRVFERFYRIERGRSRKAGGTGLGLAIVKHIAQIHGGHAEVESTLGRGSVFSIHLPEV